VAAAGERPGDVPGDPRPDRGEQRARLFVVVPGSTDAQLKVVAYTPAGAVTEFPGNPVDASAGAATPFALNSLGASAAGLKLTSNQPIVAGVLVPVHGNRVVHHRGTPITQQGVVAETRQPGGSRSACCSPPRRPRRGRASR